MAKSEPKRQRNSRRQQKRRLRGRRSLLRHLDGVLERGDARWPGSRSRCGRRWNLRAMTNSEGKRDGAVMMSSTMLLSAENSASARCSCSYWQKGEPRSIDRGYRANARLERGERPPRQRTCTMITPTRDVDRAGAAIAAARTDPDV